MHHQWIRTYLHCLSFSFSACCTSCIIGLWQFRKLSKCKWINVVIEIYLTAILDFYSTFKKQIYKQLVRYLIRDLTLRWNLHCLIPLDCFLNHFVCVAKVLLGIRLFSFRNSANVQGSLSVTVIYKIFLSSLLLRGT